MPEKNQPSSQRTKAEQLAQSLGQLRDNLAERPEAERAAALRGALDKALDASPQQADSLAEQLRARLVEDVRGRHQRLQRLEKKVETLQALSTQADQLAPLTAERDHAVSRVTELEVANARQDASLAALGKERDSLRVRVKSLEKELLAAKQAAQTAKAAMPVPAPPVHGAPPPLPGAPRQGTLLQLFREGLRDCALGQEVSPESLKLPEDIANLFELVQQLLRFSLEFDRGVQAFLMELQIGPAMDTVQVRSYQRQVEQGFCDCLDEKEGSITALKTLLDRNRRFLILLNESYRTAIPLGAVSLLEELNPETVLGRTKSRGLLRLKNYEEAYKELSGLYDDLLGLPGSELLTRYFTETFQAELRRQV